MPALKAILSSIFLASSGIAAGAAELVMVEEPGCVWCARWNAEIAPIYPKTSAGKFAPLRRIDIDDQLPDDLKVASKLTFTPTFVLIENGSEIGRIEGYPGEDFFWGILEMMLRKKTEFNEGQS